MARLALRSDVLIASPSDIRHRVEWVERAIADWNAIHAESHSVVFRPLRWERDVVPAWGRSAQECINHELVDGADGMIALLWHRIGSPTEHHISGTAEEIDRFAGTGKRPAVYVCKEPVPRDSDAHQLALVQQYEVQLQKRGLVFGFGDQQELLKLCLHYLSGLARGVLEQYRARPQPSELHGGWDEIGDMATLNDALTQLVYCRRQFELIPDQVARRGALHPDVLASFSGSVFEQFAINFEEATMRLPEHAHILARGHLIALVDLRALASRPVLQGGLTLFDACAEVVPRMVDLMLGIEDVVRDALGAQERHHAA